MDSLFFNLVNSSVQNNQAIITPPSYIVNEDFETGTVPAGWTNTAATFNYTPAIIGNYSFNGSGGAIVQFSSVDEIWFFSAVSILSFTSSPILAEMRTADNSLVSRIQVGSGQTWLLNGGSAANWILSPNTTYYIWWHYKRGTGSDATHRLYYSTNQIKPSTSILGNDSSSTTLSVGRIVFNSGIFDKIRVDNVFIGSNPL